MLTIIATMEQELAGLRQELQLQHGLVDAGGQVALARCPLQLHLVGVGRQQAEAKVRELLGSLSWRSDPQNGAEASHASPLLLLGFAGAVDPDLRPGTLSLATRYYLAREDGFPEDLLEPDRRMWRQALEAAADAGLPSTSLDSLTVDRLVSTREAKMALQRQYHVGTVNMEDYWVAAVARDVGVPFLSVRAVLDPASQNLPTYLLGLAEHQAKAVLLTIIMPWRIPTLFRLARQMRLAQRHLAHFAIHFVSRWYDTDLAKISQQ